MILLAAALAMAPAACPGDTTIAIQACAAQELKTADAELNRYYRAAVSRLQREDGAAALAKLRKSEAAWIAYRDAECDAVWQRWTPGTIAGTELLGCKTRLTRERTMAIWTAWLTYADNTPPILPKPATAS
jgi:uncharacterized protein YecT (DUF1311 family)